MSCSNLDDYRALYPVTQTKAWLNNASMGTLSAPVTDALNAYLRRHAEGEISIEHDLDLVATARAAAARFINAKPAEIAFTKNVADALNIVAQGIDWQVGDEVIIADQEFPANVFPWMHLRSRGVIVRQVRSDGSRVPFERVVEAITERTRLVSLSWIEFSTGFRNDLKAIADACHACGALFCVDGIQGVGALPLDVRETGIDMMATSSHKWLLAPTGVGWLYLREELIDQIAVNWPGQSSFTRGKSLDYLDFDLPFWPDARRYEPGILNYTGLVGLTAAIELFEKVGMDRVAGQIRKVTDYAVEGLRSAGLELISSRNSEDWSGVVSFRVPGQDPADVHRRLGEQGVVISLRGDILRISPHFYNNESDIDRFLAALV
ncbi:aminotransferase class V-fold PLP-dependent enzyme [Paracoccus onubensis]|uniref:aminotransferase class V-fold PLP-dependent enzyme n=1 Tax=Paracoccus onubensis TaxID=1675788 RepID=UPI00272F669B|nr:aminotransferase class V-fold PLP-dependent enzyme [Paracoccus onubensis]MDP0930061.1 aminotransferase class V-fold PLP-dependent enzyme [Paracoccus onubensis]